MAQVGNIGQVRDGDQVSIVGYVGKVSNVIQAGALCRNVALVGIVGQVGDVGKVGKVSKFSLVCGSDKVARCSIVSNT